MNYELWNSYHVCRIGHNRKLPLRGRGLDGIMGN